MFESITLACRALDFFGLPRAIGNLKTDRFLEANNSFFRLVDLERAELPDIRLSDVVSMQRSLSEPFEIGELIPVSIRSREGTQTINGHAAIGRNALVLIIVQQIVDPSPDFEAGAFAGKEQERKEIAAYVHENLAPDVMSAVFSIELIRLQLEKEGHSCAAKLREIQQLLNRPLQRMTEELNRKASTEREIDLSVRQ